MAYWNLLSVLSIELLTVSTIGQPKHPSPVLVNLLAEPAQLLRLHVLENAIGSSLQSIGAERNSQFAAQVTESNIHIQVLNHHLSQLPAEKLHLFDDQSVMEEQRRRKQTPGPCQVAFGSFLGTAMPSAAMMWQRCCVLGVYTCIIPPWAGVVNPPICSILTLSPTQGTGRVPVAVRLLRDDRLLARYQQEEAKPLADQGFGSHLNLSSSKCPQTTHLGSVLSDG
jgi:hypothetical protein